MDAKHMRYLYSAMNKGTIETLSGGEILSRSDNITVYVYNHNIQKTYFRKELRKWKSLLAFGSIVLLQR